MTTIGDYIIEGTVGTGTFGEVKLCQNKKGQKVVIKTIDKNAINRKLVLKEIEAGKRIHNKNIVQFLEHFEDEKNDYLVLDYIDGVNMFNHLYDRGFAAIPENDAKKIFRQLTNAIMYCHSKGVVHRDLKLENLVITKKGSVKIIDFGLCDLVTEEKSSCEGWVGSPDYVAPEILLRKEYSGQKADVWSLGTLLYIFLFAEIPFVREERYKQLANHGTHPQIEWPKEPKLPVSDLAKDLIRNMLKIDPQSRYSMKEVATHKWVVKKSSFSSSIVKPLRRITTAKQI